MLNLSSCRMLLLKKQLIYSRRSKVLSEWLIKEFGTTHFYCKQSVETFPNWKMLDYLSGYPTCSLFAIFFSSCLVEQIPLTEQYVKVAFCVSFEPHLNRLNITIYHIQTLPDLCDIGYRVAIGLTSYDLLQIPL